MIRHRAIDHEHLELTFILPSRHPAEPVGVAGEFNDWSWESTPFHRHGRLLLACAVVDSGERHRFRYRSRDGAWFNDDHADDYVPNEYGGIDCVINPTIERSTLTATEVLNSPNHRAMLQRVAEVAAHSSRAAAESQIFEKMEYTLGSETRVVAVGTNPNPLSHLLVELANVGLIERAADDPGDSAPRWLITPAGLNHLSAWDDPI